MEDIRKRIDELTAQLNEAARAYYDDASEIMTNYEYDELYDELLRLEAESGYVPEDSPSQNVGYTVQSELPKERHARRMLSLDKPRTGWRCVPGWATGRRCCPGSWMV